MVINMLCAATGAVIGVVGMGIVLWNLYRDYEENDYIPYNLDPIEINTPSYEECEELNELFEEVSF